MLRHGTIPNIFLAFCALFVTSMLAQFNLARSQPDSKPAAQPSFDPARKVNGIVYATAMQSDGMMIVGGNFTACDGIEQNRIVRLRADGGLDTSFDTGLGADGPVWAVALQPDGKIIIAGHFTSYDDIVRNRIARLNRDGQVDLSFDAGIGMHGVVYAIAVQADGKMIVGGNFTEFGGVKHNRIVRLHAGGQIDPSFDAGMGTNGTIWTIALQPDGRIIIAGDFTVYNGTKRSRIARLNDDGQLDLSFDPGKGPNYIVYAAALQADGKIVVGGDFTAYDRNKRSRVARLNTDGSLDHSFNPGLGANDAIYSITLEPGGQIIVKGDFTNYNGIECVRTVQLNADGSSAAFSHLY